MVLESSESAMLLYEKVSSGKSMDCFLQKIVEFYLTKIFETATGQKREEDAIEDYVKKMEDGVKKMEADAKQIGEEAKKRRT